MKKFTTMAALLIVTAALFAQNKDSRSVWQGTGEGDTTNLTYHLEIWARAEDTADVLPEVTPKLLELRKYGAVAFLVHAKDGYVVALYASPSYEPQLDLPNTTKKFGVVANTKASIREALVGKTFRYHITKPEFLNDLNVAYNGLP
jgi:hypothetical protein